MSFFYTQVLRGPQCPPGVAGAAGCRCAGRGREVDGGDGGGEVPLDEEDDDGSVAGSLPSGSPPKGSPPPSQASQPGSGGSQGAE